MSNKDILILRELAKQKKEFASDPINQERIKKWTDINDLKMKTPAIIIDQIPWHEMNVGGELDIHTENPYHQYLEDILRKEIYCWKHLQVDRIVSPYISSPVCLYDSGFGINEDVDTIESDPLNSVVSRHFNIQIKDENDIGKIKDPIISVDNEKTEQGYNYLQEIFGNSIEIRKLGIKGEWFTPWDNLIRLTGVEETMMDLIDRPEFIDKLVERFVDASIVRLKRYSELGIWSSNNDNTSVGSGGYGYTDFLESAKNLSVGAHLKDLWGCGNAQIFSEVSPQMHYEFSLKHEIRYLSYFGLAYYGCCEPLHNKIELLQKIPNLRKISMSPWAKLDVASNIVKKQFVMSCKPSPAIFASYNWDQNDIRKQITDILDETKNCNIEIIMKDISTVKYQPERLWEWAKIAKETVDSYYGV